MTPTGIEPVLPPWKGDVLTAWPRSLVMSTYKTSFALLKHKTPRVGLEPTTPRLTAVCSTIELSRIIYTDINQFSLIDSIRYCTFKISHGFPRTFYENRSSQIRFASFRWGLLRKPYAQFIHTPESKLSTCSCIVLPLFSALVKPSTD